MAYPSFFSLEIAGRAGLLAHPRADYYLSLPVPWTGCGSRHGITCPPDRVRPLRSLCPRHVFGDNPTILLVFGKVDSCNPVILCQDRHMRFYTLGCRRV